MPHFPDNLSELANQSLSVWGGLPSPPGRADLEVRATRVGSFLHKFSVLFHAIEELREGFACGAFQQGVCNGVGEVGLFDIGLDDEGAVLMGEHGEARRRIHLRGGSDDDEDVAFLDEEG